eukprot:scaffold1.g5893.t1
MWGAPACSPAHPDAVGRVRVAVVGTSGCGKSALCHLIAHGEPAPVAPRPTVGCAVLLSLLQYPEARLRAGARAAGWPAAQREFFLELLDVGAAERYESLRPLWYQSLNGVILVHDLSSARSLPSLQRWAQEVAQKGGGFVVPLPEDRAALNLGCLPVPALLIGNKADLLPRYRGRPSHYTCWLSALCTAARRRLRAAAAAALPWALARLGGAAGGDVRWSPRSGGGRKDGGALVHGSLQASALEGDLDMHAGGLIERRYFPTPTPDAGLPPVMWHPIAEGSVEGTPRGGTPLVAGTPLGGTPFGSLTPVRGSSKGLLGLGRFAPAQQSGSTGRIDDLL